jgi:hypothetical protein
MPHASGTCSAGLATLRIWSGPKVPGWMPSGPSVSRETWGPAGLRRPTRRPPWSLARSTHGGGRAGGRASHACSRPPTRATPGRRTGRATNGARRGRGSAKAGWEGCSTGRGGGEPGRESGRRSRAGRPHLLPRPVRNQAVRLVGHQAVRQAGHQAVWLARHRMAQPTSPQPVRPARTLDGSRGPRGIRARRHRLAQFLSHPVVGRTRHLAGRERRHRAGRERRHPAGSAPGRWGAVAPCPRSGSLPTG